MSRYKRNSAISDQSSSRNPHECVIMPSFDLEKENEKWEASMRVVFSQEQVEVFKTIRSYVQFRQYCQDQDLPILL